MRFYMMIAVIFLMTAGAAAAGSAERTKSVRDVYTLGSGDRVKVTVYGETDLSGVFEISGTGVIAYPLIGEADSLEHQLDGEARLIGNVTVQRMEDGKLVDAVHDVTFAFSFHAFNPDGTIHK